MFKKGFKKRREEKRRENYCCRNAAVIQTAK
jgi:hypothetical protein